MVGLPTVLVFYFLLCPNSSLYSKRKKAHLNYLVNASKFLKVFTFNQIKKLATSNRVFIRDLIELILE